MKIACELFSWFKHQSICPDIRALNATIFFHATPNSIIGKGYCVWRSQMSFLADFNTSWYVLMLERWMLPFTYIQHPTVSLVRDIVHEDHKWVFLADLSTSSYILILERWILPCPYIQRQTVLLVRNIVSEDHKWVLLAYLITSSYVLMLERWMLPYSYIQRPTVLLISNNVHEDHKWIF